MVRPHVFCRGRKSAFTDNQSTAADFRNPIGRGGPNPDRCIDVKMRVAAVQTDVIYGERVDAPDASPVELLTQFLSI